MDFSYYIDFFHDGSLFGIEHDEARIEFTVCSAEIEPEYNRDGVALDEHDRLHGILSVQGVTSVIVNDDLTSEVLQIKFGEGEVLDFDIRKGRVALGIQWPGSSGDWSFDFSYMVIGCEKVTWHDFPSDLTLDVSDMLAWPPHSPIPFSLPCAHVRLQEPPDRGQNQQLSAGLLGAKRNRNWPPGRDYFEAIQNGWKHVPRIGSRVVGHHEVKDEGTGDIWRFDETEHGRYGPHGVDHWHHLNPDLQSAQIYLDLNGRPCSGRTEASRIYWTDDPVTKAPAPLNEAIDFAYYLGFFHDGSLSSIQQSESSVAFEMASSEILPEHNRDGIELDEEGCMRGSLVLQGLDGMLLDHKRFDGKLLMEGGEASLLDLTIRGNLVYLGLLWLSHPRLPRSDFSSIHIWCKKVFWQDAVAGLTVDLTELLGRR